MKELRPEDDEADPLADLRLSLNQTRENERKSRVPSVRHLLETVDDGARKSAIPEDVTDHIREDIVINDSALVDSGMEKVLDTHGLYRFADGELGHIEEWEGYIHKRAHFLKDWRRRYVVLQGSVLTFFLSKQKARQRRVRTRVQALGSFNCAMDHEHCFIVKTKAPRTEYHCRCRSHMEKQMWINMIRRGVEFDQARHSTATTPAIAVDQIKLQGVRTRADLANRTKRDTGEFYGRLKRLMRDPWDEKVLSDISELLRLCLPDVHVISNIPLGLCAGGEFHGREGLFQCLDIFFSTLDINSFTVDKTKAVGSASVTNGTISIRCRLTNAKIRCNWEHQLRFSRGGRIEKICFVYESDKIGVLFPPDDEEIRPYGSRTKRILSLSIRDFELVKLLGRGGFGTVALARKVQTADLYAVKVLDKKSMTKYDISSTRTEMRILRDVHHPFIVALRFAFQSANKVYFGMDYYPGGSLYAHMRMPGKKDRRLTPDRVRFYTAELVVALLYLHSLGICYRDLKPDNILVDGNGHIALVDFGLSKLHCSSNAGGKTMAGSPAYTAPELLKPREERAYGNAVDWWCLGVMLYEMSVGYRPFRDRSIEAVYEKIKNDEVIFPPTPKLPSVTRDFIRRLLEKDPQRRLGVNKQELLHHPYLRDIDWEALLKKEIRPPWVPVRIYITAHIPIVHGLIVYPISHTIVYKTQTPDEELFTDTKLLELDADGMFVSAVPGKLDYFFGRAEEPAVDFAPERGERFTYVRDYRDSLMIDQQKILESLELSASGESQS